ncbi:MAG TPA: hypothetical protein VF120_03510 [Ktedonobacterales bacterium]
MSLDEQLAELLGQLGVQLESGEMAAGAVRHDTAAGEGSNCPQCHRPREAALGAGVADAQAEADAESLGFAEVSLFQTSREHYGVFYRLDLIGGVPQLRIFTPEEEGALKMRCYLVRPSPNSPLRTWFDATRGHEGSAAYEESRETTEQHLLFAAGETLKRLFWAGEPDEMAFPAEIVVQRLA